VATRNVDLRGLYAAIGK
jgi:hypothetical protein